MSDVLIAYYSRRVQNYASGDIKDLARGNAEILAGFAAEATGGTLFEIDTAKQYPEDYNACTEAALGEKNAHARPELRGHLKNADAYDTIVLVYPNWWGTMPMAVYTFLEENGFAGRPSCPSARMRGAVFRIQNAISPANARKQRSAEAWPSKAPALPPRKTS